MPKATIHQGQSAIGCGCICSLVFYWLDYLQVTLLLYLAGIGFPGLGDIYIDNWMWRTQQNAKLFGRLKANTKKLVRSLSSALSKLQFLPPFHLSIDLPWTITSLRDCKRGCSTVVFCMYGNWDSAIAETLIVFSSRCLFSELGGTTRDDLSTVNIFLTCPVAQLVINILQT